MFLQTHNMVQSSSADIDEDLVGEWVKWVGTFCSAQSNLNKGAFPLQNWRRRCDHLTNTRRWLPWFCCDKHKQLQWHTELECRYEAVDQQNDRILSALKGSFFRLCDEVFYANGIWLLKGDATRWLVIFIVWKSIDEKSFLSPLQKWKNWGEQEQTRFKVVDNVSFGKVCT